MTWKRQQWSLWEYRVGSFLPPETSLRGDHLPQIIFHRRQPILIINIMAEDKVENVASAMKEGMFNIFLFGGCWYVYVAMKKFIFMIWYQWHTLHSSIEEGSLQSYCCFIVWLCVLNLKSRCDDGRYCNGVIVHFLYIWYATDIHFVAYDMSNSSTTVTILYKLVRLDENGEPLSKNALKKLLKKEAADKKKAEKAAARVSSQ